MEPLTCDKAEILLNLRLDGLLDEAGAARLDAHRTACPACQVMLADLETLNATLAALPDEPAPSAVLAGVLARFPAPVPALAPANGLARWRWLLRAGLALEAVAAALLLLLYGPQASVFLAGLLPTAALAERAAGRYLTDGIGAWLAWLNLQGSLLPARWQLLSDLVTSLQVTPPAWNVLAPAAVLLVAMLLAWIVGNRVLVTVSLRAKT
jgi:hypothetical protein